jgi:hypothetical protein
VKGRISGEDFSRIYAAYNQLWMQEIEMKVSVNDSKGAEAKFRKLDFRVAIARIVSSMTPQEA